MYGFSSERLITLNSKSFSELIDDKHQNFEAEKKYILLENENSSVALQTS